MQIHISGRASTCECRFTRAGVPVLHLELPDVNGQSARITHTYHDSSNASGYAAKAMAARVRGQHVELDVINPRFKAKRLEGEAPVIHIAQPSRKDIE